MPGTVSEFFRYLQEDCSYLNPMEIGNGEYVCLVPFLFTVGIIRGKIGDETGYSERWCYHDYPSALAAMRDCDWTTTEPEGWHRHIPSGRRRSDQ